jgi:NAD(P)-dependent dehydrogenase (short-subunit alcohol dehydrogenase family)
LTRKRLKARRRKYVRSAFMKAIVVDVADEASVDSMVQATLKREGRLDILVNNAGIAIRRPAVDLALGDWDKVLSVNLTGSFLCARAAAGPMISLGSGGAIVNVSSIMGPIGRRPLSECILSGD